MVKLDIKKVKRLTIWNGLSTIISLLYMWKFEICHLAYICCQPRAGLFFRAEEGWTINEEVSKVHNTGSIYLGIDWIQYPDVHAVQANRYTVEVYLKDGNFYPKPETNYLIKARVWLFLYPWVR